MNFMIFASMAALGLGTSLAIADETLPEKAGHPNRAKDVKENVQTMTEDVADQAKKTKRKVDSIQLNKEQRGIDG